MVDGFGHKYAGIMNAIDQRLGDTQDTIDTLGSTYFGAGGEGVPVLGQRPDGEWDSTRRPASRL
jgi:hypothetical protein